VLVGVEGALTIPVGPFAIYYLSLFDEKIDGAILHDPILAGASATEPERPAYKQSQRAPYRNRVVRTGAVDANITTACLKSQPNVVGSINRAVEVKGSQQTKHLPQPEDEFRLSARGIRALGLNLSDDRSPLGVPSSYIMRGLRPS
jgi:hypothetical protein